MKITGTRNLVHWSWPSPCAGLDSTGDRSGHALGDACPGHSRRQGADRLRLRRRAWGDANSGGELRLHWDDYL